MSERQDQAWQTESLAQTFLEGVRGGLPFAAEQIDLMQRVIQARGEPVENFLDLGCGDGILSRAILDIYPHARGTLVDFSEPMLKAARAKLSPWAGQLSLEWGDLGARAWLQAVEGRAPFDAIVSGYAIHHLPEERQAELYREIFDLLKPGGVFVNAEHVASPTAWVGTLADECLVDSLYAFHTRTGSGKTRAQVTDEFVHRPDKAANYLIPVETLCRWWREIGFQDVDCYFKIFELAVLGGRRPRGTY